MCSRKETKLVLADETRNATEGSVKDLRKGGKFKRLFTLNDGGKSSIIGTIAMDHGSYFSSIIAIPEIESATCFVCKTITQTSFNPLSQQTSNSPKINAQRLPNEHMLCK